MRLQNVLHNRKKHELLIFTGDMNTKVGEDNWDYDKVMGEHGLGQPNENGERLCEFCDMNELVITRTLFPHKNIHKATWVSPNRITMNQIDHILINERLKDSVKDTRVYRSANIGSGHYLVCITVKLRLTNQAKEKKGISVKYDTTKLKNENTLKTFRLHSLCIPHWGRVGFFFWRGVSNFLERDKGGLSKFLTDGGLRGRLSKNSVDVGRGES